MNNCGDGYGKKVDELEDEVDTTINNYYNIVINDSVINRSVIGFTPPEPPESDRDCSCFNKETCLCEHPGSAGICPDNWKNCFLYERKEHKRPDAIGTQCDKCGAQGYLYYNGMNLCRHCSLILFTEKGLSYYHEWEKV